MSVVDEPLREGLFCDRNHHKLPQEEAIAYIEQNKNIKQTHSISKKKMYFGVDRPELSPLTYPTPSPYSKSASIEEWTLYLGDLKRNCSEKTIRKLFSKFALKKIKIIKSKTVYGFVSFLNKSDMETAMLEFQGKEILGSKIRIQRAATEIREQKRLKRNKSIDLKPELHHFYSNRPHLIQKKLFLDVFIGYLPPNASEENIKDSCCTFGKVIQAIIVREKYTGKRMGYSFVHFCDVHSKNRALKQGSVSILGKSCIILSTTRDKNEQGPFSIRVSTFRQQDWKQFSQKINKAVLAKSFIQFGALQNIHLSRDQAVIDFYQKNSQQACLHSWSGGTTLQGKGGYLYIKVESFIKIDADPERSISFLKVNEFIEQNKVSRVFTIFGGVKDVIFISKKHKCQDIIVSFHSKDSQIKALNQGKIKIDKKIYIIRKYKDKESRVAEFQVSLSNIPKELMNNEDSIKEPVMKEFGEITRLWFNLLKSTATIRFKTIKSKKKAASAGKLRLGNHVIFIDGFENLVIGRTLHVGNLPKLVSEEEPKQFFESLLGNDNGLVKTVLSWPWINILFETQDYTELAYSKIKEQIFKGKRLTVKYHQRYMIGNKVGNDYDKTVRITGFIKGITKQQIELKCSPMGKVVDLKLKNSFANVTFDNIESAQKAVVQMDNKNIIGSMWKVRSYRNLLEDSIYINEEHFFPLKHPIQYQKNQKNFSPHPFLYERHYQLLN